MNTANHPESSRAADDGVALIPSSWPPVVLLVFNRPRCTQRVLDEIRRARPQKLFVVADGPRESHPNDIADCAAVRRILEEGIDWPCEVVRVFSDMNLGCAHRVSSGLDQVFAQVEEAIILEDDCVPHPSFFPFCAELLSRYRHESRIAQIAGCSFQHQVPNNAASYYFSRYPHCWGWATWRRAWSKYDHQMIDWRTTAGDGWLKRMVEIAAEREYWTDCFNSTANGGVDSWAYRWTSTVWSRNWLTVLPYRNLVSNIGFDANATHTRSLGPSAMRPLSEMPFPLVHPPVLCRGFSEDESTRRLLFQKAAWIQRLRGRLTHLISR